MLRDLAAQWLPGDGLYREISLIVVTEAVGLMVRVTVGTDGWVLR